MVVKYYYLLVIIFMISSILSENIGFNLPSLNNGKIIQSDTILSPETIHLTVHETSYSTEEKIDELHLFSDNEEIHEVSTNILTDVLNNVWKLVNKEEKKEIFLIMVEILVFKRNVEFMNDVVNLFRRKLQRKIILWKKTKI
ncbi:unnamed protein product [Rotaria sp. Silwood1]|nr:unnamed protein product [Rotaria sp. Silwood1]